MNDIGLAFPARRSRPTLCPRGVLRISLRLPDVSHPKVDREGGEEGRLFRGEIRTRQSLDDA